MKCSIIRTLKMCNRDASKAVGHLERRAYPIKESGVFMTLFMELWEHFSQWSVNSLIFLKTIKHDLQ